MTESELQERLEELRLGLSGFAPLHLDKGDDYESWSKGEATLTAQQTQLVQKLFDLFRSLNWQIRLNGYKKIELEKSKAIEHGRSKCGTPVMIRPIGEEYGNKTYFGILLGDIATTIHHVITKDDTLVASFSMHNPAIYVPELRKIIYGYESWWGEIKSEDDLSRVITDTDIQSGFQAQLLKLLFGGRE